jgi:hypothetical protein
MQSTVLKVQKGNAKLNRNKVFQEEGQHINIWSQPAGHSCPHASKCFSIANRITGKIKDKETTEYRCYAASDEAKSPQARRARHHNFELVKHRNEDEMVAIIDLSMPGGSYHRVHGSGDFFNYKYFSAWMRIALMNPAKLFYAYTKALPYWKQWLEERGSLPVNFNLIASRGGTHDHLIEELGLRYSEVVFHPEEAEELGLRIDHNDEIAMFSRENFALVLHGTQPAGSKAGKAKIRMTKEQVQYSYSRKQLV